MSLILEALRKSEAERQRGRAPGLFVEQVPVRAQRARTVPAWAWGMGLLLLGVLALFAWREWGRGGGSEPGSTATTTSPDPGGVAPTAADQAPMHGAPTSLPTPAPASPYSGATAPVPVPAPTAAPDASTARPAPAAVAAAPAQTVSPASPTPAVAVPAPLPAPAPTPSPATSPPPQATAAPAEPALPSLSSLGTAQRAELPPLRLSMHVYADDPAQRFVILDGQRLGEGASPVQGVVLEQIRRDGLVLSVNGQRLLLPRP